MRDRINVNFKDIAERKDNRSYLAATIICNATGTVHGSGVLAMLTLAECSHRNEQSVFQMEEGGSRSLSQQATVALPHSKAQKHWATKTPYFNDA